MLSDTSASLGKEAGGMVLYVLAILIFDLILLGITRTSKTMSACIPILLLCCIVFCPIFIDVGMYFAPARHIQKIFLPYHYMNFFL
jgi:ABC-2 type transport system permease protein